MTETRAEQSTKTGHNLPMVIEPQPDRPSLQRQPVNAAFVSQLIAEREHLAPQRARRRASESHATAAYGAASRMTVLRMPAGYNRAVSA